jgi:hypothetical protein
MERIDIRVKNTISYICFLGSIVMIVYGSVYCNVKVRNHKCPKNCYYENCSHYEIYDDDEYTHKTTGYYIYGTCSCPRVNPDGTTVFMCSSYETHSIVNAGYVCLLVFGMILFYTTVAYWFNANVNERNKTKCQVDYHEKIRNAIDEEYANASAPPFPTIYNTSPLHIHTLPIAEAM